MFAAQGSALGRWAQNIPHPTRLHTHSAHHASPSGPSGPRLSGRPGPPAARRWSPAGAGTGSPPCRSSTGPFCGPLGDRLRRSVTRQKWGRGRTSGLKTRDPPAPAARAERPAPEHASGRGGRRCTWLADQVVEPLASVSVFLLWAAAAPAWRSSKREGSAQGLKLASLAPCNPGRRQPAAARRGGRGGG